MEIQNPRQLGLLVAGMRKACGMTQAQLAERAGISRQLVNRLEMGDAAGMALGRILSVLSALNATFIVECSNTASDREVLGVALSDGPSASTKVPSTLDTQIDLPKIDDSLFAPSAHRGGA